MIPTYRACSFPALKLYQNITTHLHISHTWDFLPAVTRRSHQGLENIPDRDRKGGEGFLQERPGWKSSSSQERCCSPPAPCLGLLSGAHLSVSNVRLHPGNKKLPIVSPLSTASWLLSGKMVSLHPSMRMVSIFPFYYVHPWTYSGTERKSPLGSLSPTLSPMVFLGILLVAAHTAVLDFNHTEVTWNSHDSCQSSSHTSFAKTSVKTNRPFNFSLAKL